MEEGKGKPPSYQFQGIRQYTMNTKNKVSNDNDVNGTSLNEGVTPAGGGGCKASQFVIK